MMSDLSKEDQYKKPEDYTPPKSADELLDRYNNGERYFSKANLRRANLSRAELSELDLSESDLSEANLSEIDFSESNLARANFSGANLIRSNLSEADLSEANLEGASLIRSNLINSNFKQANLVGTNLWRANVVGTDFQQANLVGADLTDTDLSESNLKEVTYNTNTRYPEDLDVNKYEMTEVDLSSQSQKTERLLVNRNSKNQDTIGVRSSSYPPPREKYKPYPLILVEELEKLTLGNAVQPDGEAPDIEAKRQTRIDEICIKLKSIPSPMPGDTVVGANLVRIIGKGNLGTVWQAIDVRTGEPRAVKIFDTNRLGQGLALYHFRSGVRAMEHLQSIDDRPSPIIEIYEIDESKLAFSMKYLESGDLRGIAKRAWDLKEKLSVFHSVVDAVNFAHKNEVIHRNIEPANVLMSKTGESTLTNFNIADISFIKTQSSLAIGIMPYLAPEQLNGEWKRGAAGDVYSLGKLLYYLLLEKDPEILSEEIPELNDLTDQPLGLVRIIRKCTIKEPGSRYQSAEELLGDLLKYENKPKKVGIGPTGLLTGTKNSLFKNVWNRIGRSR